MADPKPNGGGLGQVGAAFRRTNTRLRQLEAPDGVQTSVTNSDPVNTTSVQADQFLGGSFTGTSCTVSGPVFGSQGTFTTGIKSTGVRTTTLTNSPVQLYVDADGNLGVGASTRAKKNIGTDYKVDMTKFLAVVLKNWTYKDNPLAAGMGPIADDLDAAGLKEFVIYNLDGSIQGVRSDMLIIGLWSAYVQSRTATLAEFNKRLKQTVTVTNMSALSIGGTRPYTITWDKPFTDADYAVYANVYSNAGVLISGAVAASLPSSRTTTQCVVQVTSGVALLSGQTLVVEAIHV